MNTPDPFKKFKVQIVLYQKQILALDKSLRIEKNKNKELTATITKMKREST